MKRIITFILFFFITGCVNTSQYIQPAVMPVQNSAKIYIFRPFEFYGSPLNAPVYVNNDYIGRLGVKGHLTWITQPGIVTISTDPGVWNYEFKNKSHAILTFDAKKNQTYYIKLTFPTQVTILTPGYDIELMNSREGRRAMLSL